MATSAQLHQIMDGPALAPPDGIVPNLINPDNQTGCYILTIVICVTFSSLAVLARLYTKLRIARKIGWEDCKFPGKHLVDFDSSLSLSRHRYIFPRLGTSLLVTI